MPVVPTKLGRLIRERREDILEATQAELAEACGLTQGHISELERGVKRPSLPTLRKLRDGMGLTDAEYAVWLDEASKDKPKADRVLSSGRSEGEAAA